MMRKILVIGLVAALAAPAALGTVASQTRYYHAAGHGDVLGVGPLIVDFFVAYGGNIFVGHPHTTTATVAIQDDLNGGVDGIVCQDLDNDRLCDTRSGSADRWACAYDGSLSGFAIDASANPQDKPVYVFVFTQFWTIPECSGHVGEGTTGSITVTYG